MLKVGDKVRMNFEVLSESGYEGLTIEQVAILLDNKDAVYTVIQIGKPNTKYPVYLMEIGGRFALNELIKV